MNNLVFIDLEIDKNTKEIIDFGAFSNEENLFHKNSKNNFMNFINHYEYIAGHNILNHDIKFIDINNKKIIDTLYLSTFFDINKNYHNLDKLYKENDYSSNNPIEDCKESKKIFINIINIFKNLNHNIKTIYYLLLKDNIEFKFFFQYMNYKENTAFNISKLIYEYFNQKICINTDIDNFINTNPLELAFALNFIDNYKKNTILPHFINKNYPLVYSIINILTNNNCNNDKCIYCKTNFNIKNKLKFYFNYDEFRTFDNDNLQEKAVLAALNNKSFIVVFPTGGGKSLTYQLPALISNSNMNGLTVVISPLQALMKDQVDNLSKKNIDSIPITINGLLEPIERKYSIENVENGNASILYISPESLRSNTIERLLYNRNIIRFVIDEAHCFSSWGHDFRVDYLYIGKFIKKYQETKNIKIPISLFTATAKQNVLDDIFSYFKTTLNLELELFKTKSIKRTNLNYKIINVNNDNEKYKYIRSLIEEHNCVTIIYASRVKTVEKISEKLQKDNINAKYFHAKMNPTDKINVQNEFMNGEINVMVATSAFGMGIDKNDVALVIHYDISDSIENYIQESGRAGRNQNLTANCYILYNEKDLDKHFLLFNRNKLNINEINKVWKAIKDLSYNRKFFSISTIELARYAGFNENKGEIDTKIKTAVQYIENAGYIKRKNNSTLVFADSLNVKNMKEASSKIENSTKFNDNEKKISKEIVRSLISKKYTHLLLNEEAEYRIDYLSDILGYSEKEIVKCINILSEEKIISSNLDLRVFPLNSKENKNLFTKLENYIFLEKELFKIIEKKSIFDLKLINNYLKETFGNNKSSKNKITEILYFWQLNNIIDKKIILSDYFEITLNIDKPTFKIQTKNKENLSKFIIEYLLDLNNNLQKNEFINFSIFELKEKLNNEFSIEEIQNTLLYLSKINLIKIDGGFLVLYNKINLERIEMDNRKKYTKDDYKTLSEHYCQKIKQIHFVDKYAKIMIDKLEDSYTFLNDYFQLEYTNFEKKYFNENLNYLNNPITTTKYNEIFNTLSTKQLEIINDKNSKQIIVLAGPGSGKTRVLVHKLASLLLLEDVKPEELLMLTFSRAAANEFKNKLKDLVDELSYSVDIKTFHSFCFDILEKKGDLEKSENIIKEAIEIIKNDEAEYEKISKSVLVIDEAQDMSETEYNLIKILQEKNDNELKIIAVGDDDQNIYAFRGSDSKYFYDLKNEENSKIYELTDNYRSATEIVNFSNYFSNLFTVKYKNYPIIPIKNNAGNIEFINYKYSNFEKAILYDLKNKNLTTNTAILTSTNDEALIIMSLLKNNGFNVKLIEDNSEFNLYNLCEFRYFLNQFSNLDTNIIDNNLWNNAITNLKKVYQKSTILHQCIEILNSFYNLNTDKYLSDLELFIKESSFSDTNSDEKDKIIISTMHKSKGKEFDNVYILINFIKESSIEEEKRKLYVAFTRAKENLYIHYKNDVFENLIKTYKNEDNYKLDTNFYTKSEKIILNLNIDDFILDDFVEFNDGTNKGIKNLILSLRSGDSININTKNYTIYKNNIRLARLSKKGKFKLSKYQNYTVEQTIIKYIFAWKKIKNDNCKSFDENKEWAVFTANIYLKS